jgi:hypothetical protein
MTLEEAKTEIKESIKELHENGKYHAEFVQENGNLVAEGLRQALDILEKVDTEPKWIPCGERLPEEETDVLVCNANGDIQISRGSYSTEMRDYFIWYTTGWRFGKVIAWMPMPEPTRLDGEEE